MSHSTISGYDAFGKSVTTDPRLLRVFRDLQEIDHVAPALSNIAILLGTVQPMFKELLKIEFESTTQQQILRSNNLVTKAVDTLIKMVCQDYLKKLLYPLVSKLVNNSKLDLEIDSNVITDQDVLEKHQKKLAEKTTQFLDRILSDESVKDMPIEMKCIAKIIWDFSEKHQLDPFVIVGSFLMLRVLNPPICFPDKKQIISKQITDNKIRRNLLLISKVVQNLANRIPFGDKEQYMVCMNPILKAYDEKAKEFIKKVCFDEAMDEYITTQAKNVDSNVQTQVLSKFCLGDLVTIHKAIKQNMEEFEKIFKEAQSDDFAKLMATLPENPPEVTKTDIDVVEKAKEASKTEAKYRALLEKAKQTNLDNVERANILTFHGTDKQGNPVAVLVEANIGKIDLEKVFLYMIKKLDPFVEKQYCLVWCVDNSARASRPSLAWVVSIYNSITRKYKKNLKALYLLHPTFIYKLIVNVFTPLVSTKFWRKLHTINYVEDLYKYIDRNQLPLAPSVLGHDFMIRKDVDVSKDQYKFFGKHLKTVMENPDHVGKKIPIGIEKVFNFIEQKGLKVEGIFRVGGVVNDVQRLKILLDYRENVDLNLCDIHALASVIKLFFREMPEPLFTFDRYNRFLALLEKETIDDDFYQNELATRSMADRIRALLQELPIEHYNLAKALFSLLYKITKFSHINKMTSNNLAIVFGPNILRTRGDNALAQLKEAGSVTKVTELIINLYSEIFENAEISQKQESKGKQPTEKVKENTEQRRKRGEAFLGERALKPRNPLYRQGGKFTPIDVPNTE